MIRLFLLLAYFVSHSFAEDEGFVDLFDGKSLEGWDGDPVYWSVKDGMIVGEVTTETLLDRNSFLIWREFDKLKWPWASAGAILPL